MNDENESPDKVDCPHCGLPTASEGLRCIFCGERLNLPAGGLSWLAFKGGGLIALGIAVLLLAAFIALILL